MSSNILALIAEELSPASLGGLGTDFDFRHVDGASCVLLLLALAAHTLKTAPGPGDARLFPESA